jgi:hypothetical protein
MTSMAVHTWTDSPEDAIWNHLRFLSHLNNATRLLQGGLGCTVKREIAQETGSRKARQLSACIQQAEEYYNAARRATIATSPLLLFYGMLSLAKALVVANHSTLLLEDINYHGLKRAKGESDDVPLEEINLMTDGGVFEEFMKIATGIALPRNAEVRFKDILATRPSVSEFYSRYYSEQPNCFGLYDSHFGGTGENHVSLSISKYNYGRELTVENILALIPGLAEDFVIEPGLHHGQVYRFYTNTLRAMPAYMGFYHSPIGGRYVIGGLPSRVGGVTEKRYVFPACAEYRLIFLLSDCVRYRQEFWSRIISGEQTGVLGIVDMAIAHTVRHFPNFILDCLFGQTFTYGTPGYLG